MRAREFGKLRRLAVAGDRGAARAFCVACAERKIQEARLCPIRGCAICPSPAAPGGMGGGYDGGPTGSPAGSGGAP